MRLRAIRVQEFRRFTGPVCIEGLSGGLDVLAAPNEDGKSTLFEAVRTVISEKYSAGAGTKKMKAIQPYSGGAPLVEIDFDLAGRGYRLRKQFVRKPDAVLADRDTGEELARKDDVEHWLEDYLKSQLPFGLFWVAQNAATQPVTLEAAAQSNASALRGAVEAEVGAITGGAVRDKVRHSLADDLAALVSSRGPRKGGAYADAVAARDAARAALESAKQARREVDERMSALAKLRAEQSATRQDADTANLAEVARTAETALRTAEDAANRLREARAEEEAACHQIAAARQALAFFEQQAQEHDTLVEVQAVATTALAQAREAQDAAEQTHRAAQARRATIIERLDALRAEDARAVQLGERDALEQRRSREAARRDEAIAARDRAAETRAFLADEPVTEETLQRLKTLAGEIAELSLLIEQQTPKITMHYDEGQEGRVHAGKQTLAHGLARPVTERVELMIDGIGRLVVDPGAPRDRDDEADDLRAQRAQRDALMQDLGVTSLKEAQSRRDDRIRREQMLLSDEERFATLAPSGIDALDESLARVDRDLAAIPARDEHEQVRERATIAADIETCRADQTAADDVLQQSAKALEEARIAATARRREVDDRAAQISGLFAQLAGAGGSATPGRAANFAELSANVARAATRENEAVRQVAAWGETAVGAEALADLRDRHARALQEANASAAALRVIDEKVRVAEAVLRERSEDGVDERVAECARDLEIAERDVSYHERRVAGLRLLAETMDDVAEETRAAYTKPVVERMSPYVSTLFPGARIEFAEDFKAQGFLRNGTPEMFSDVSMGTQEQLGVLIRLGFARLFAERGQPLPLILDDALVYSDDMRIERMFDALRMAARAHQVIVLTCRMKTFGQLGGERLAIEPAAFA
ncbi:MAG: hypothetical protein AAFQ35_09770 [Pseudomonadota bacterium]